MRSRINKHYIAILMKKIMRSLIFWLFAISFLISEKLAFGQAVGTGPNTPNCVHVSADYHVSATDVIIYINSTLEGFTIYLPLTSSTPAGTSRAISIQDEGQYTYFNNVVVLAQEGELILGYGNNVTFNGEFLGMQYLANPDGGNVWMRWTIN
jgi:hypothetical protein